MFVSLQPREFTLDKLICLAQTLRDRRPDRKSFGVFFFDSHEAAERFQGDPVEGGFPPRWHEWAKELHATYSFDADKHEETIEIIPMGFIADPSLDTSLDLPLAAKPHCRLEIQNRCLMAAVEKITYPQSALEARASGVIVLAGTVDRDGRVTGLHLAEADVIPGEEKKRLVNAALHDLETWQFDAGAHADPIRITYSFAVDSSLPRGVVPQVQWASPNEVTVRANPPE
ncbi:MAG: energy transducer TonB [Terracidiphilus sp.]